MFLDMGINRGSGTHRRKPHPLFSSIDLPRKKMSEMYAHLHDLIQASQGSPAHDEGE